MKLPIFKDLNQNFMLMQTKWASILNTTLGNQLNQVSLLKNISLNNGTTVINHLLGKTQSGWFIVDQNAAASIYRSAAFNATTLTLTSNAAVVISLGVF